MHRIIRLFIQGKSAWSLEELVADPTILTSAREAEELGLVNLRIGSLSKGRYDYGVPIDLQVTGLTAAGQLMVDAGG